jgi:protein involved in polysaccharide export with SLBB domain
MGPTFDPRQPQATVPAFQEVKTAEPLKPELLKPPTEPFRLGVGDKLEIEVMQEGNSRQECRVMPDGMLYYSAIPGVTSAGLTVPELKQKLETNLRDLYLRPQVSIVLRGITSRRVWVLGRVNAPGLYPIENPITVLEAISRAGGLFTSHFSGSTEELADLRHSFLIRQGQFLPVDFYKLIHDGDLSQNVYLADGDYIYLPSSLSSEIYVLGAVRQPKAIGYSDLTTLVSAIANTRGLQPYAYAQRVVIVRGSLAQPKVALVDFNRIAHGQDPDILLEPRDIVWVPNSPWEKVESYTKMIVNSFVRTIAANEGIHAGSSSGENIKPNLNISQ